MTQSLASVDLSTLEAGSLEAAALSEQAVLFVNVASRCGLTPQYADLVELSRQGASQGLVVVGVPCNQFGKQEPGTAEEIREFCSANYGVDFPLLAKQEVNGPGRSSLYRFLVDSEVGGGEDIQWNFEKFLVARGEVVGRFTPQVQPLDPQLLEALAKATGSDA